MMSACMPLAMVPWDTVGLEGSDIGQGACVGRPSGAEDFKVHCYALPPLL